MCDKLGLVRGSATVAARSGGRSLERNVVTTLCRLIRSKWTWEKAAVLSYPLSVPQLDVVTEDYHGNLGQNNLA
jgi:hypothetical protein